MSRKYGIHDVCRSDSSTFPFTRSIYTCICHRRWRFEHLSYETLLQDAIFCDCICCKCRNWAQSRLNVVEVRCQFTLRPFIHGERISGNHRITEPVWPWWWQLIHLPRHSQSYSDWSIPSILLWFQLRAFKLTIISKRNSFKSAQPSS
jgi:hypothetical protein